jgi:hypothetical protein
MSVKVEALHAEAQRNYYGARLDELTQENDMLRNAEKRHLDIDYAFDELDEAGRKLLLEYAYNLVQEKHGIEAEALKKAKAKGAA